MTQSVLSRYQAARSYAERGWRVIPLHSVNKGRCSCEKQHCPSAAKHPRIGAWPKAATTNGDTVEQWKRRWPDANIGIVTGSSSGLLVVDVDGEAGAQSMRHLEKESGPIPPTVTAMTGRGHHYYFAFPQYPTRSSTGVRPGIDIRADGGMVVAPPSVHATGSVYQFVSGRSPQDIDLATAPPCFSELARETASRTGQSEFIELPGQDVAKSGRPIPSGQRNSTLFRMGSAMRGVGFSEETITNALQTQNDLTCQPPLSDKEVARIGSSCARYTPEVPRTGGIYLPRELSKRLRIRPQEWRFFYFLLEKATWRKQECGAGTLGVGEVRFSYREVCTTLAWKENNRVVKWSTSRISRMIEWLKCQGLIEVLGTAPLTRVRVVNYEQFQGIPSGKLRIPGASLEQHGTRDSTGLRTPPPPELAANSLAGDMLNSGTRNGLLQQPGTQ